MRVYKKYMVLRIGGKSVEMMNPQIVDGSRSWTSRSILEQSSMCPPEEEGVTERRYESVRLKWIDIDNEWVERTLSGPESWCAQHHVAVLNGWWPCKSSYRMPVVKAQTRSL
jgi:peptide deformylase